MHYYAYYAPRWGKPYLKSSRFGRLPPHPSRTFARLHPLAAACARVAAIGACCVALLALGAALDA